MPKINILPKSVAELIAAGEVVERPASVIKELLENSIDSGATSITAEIKNGGITYIRISDNGCGIERGDVKNAFLSHATSKIANENDLNSIMTLGFRGEALASIAAVSKVELLTKTANEEIGTRYRIEAGEEILLDDAGCPAGTTIAVRDLFFCTPARMKFLKKDVSEGNAVSGVVERAALSNPFVSFRFIREGKQVLLTSGSGDLLTTVREIFGKEFVGKMIPVGGETDGIKVNGLISLPHASRPNRNMQFFFVNGRFVKSATASAALSEAYKNSVMVGKFPSCVLNIELNPQTVDVNVHPAKTEVRFSNEKSVFSSVYFACKNALSNDTTRAAFTRKTIDYHKEPLEKPEQFKLTETNGGSGFWQHTAVSEINLKKSESEASPRPAQTESNSIYKPVFRTSEPVGYSVPGDDRPNLIPKTIYPQVEEKNEVITTDNSVQAADDSVYPVLIEDKSDFSEEKFRLIGEAFRTYIIVEYESKILVIDKHAAHERMIFEELKKSNSQRSPQVLLSPVSVQLSDEEYSSILLNSDALRAAGFDVTDFGQGMVIVNECPMELSADEIPDVICEIAGNLASKKQSVDFDKLDFIYHSVACRSAVKAGDITSRYEMEIFAKKLLSTPSVKYCPHGRPVLIEISRGELEKNFGRA